MPKIVDDRQLPPKSWSGHDFTQEEIDTLMAGGEVFARDFVSNRTGFFYSASIRYGEVNGRMQIIADFMKDLY